MHERLDFLFSNFRRRGDLGMHEPERQRGRRMSTLHAVRERPLVGVRDADRERVDAAIRRHARERASVRVGRREPRTVVVRALHHIAVDRVRLNAMQRRMHARAALERVQTVRRRIRVRKRAGLEMRHMAATAMSTVGHAHALIAEAHVDEPLLTVMVAPIRVVVLPLQLVLDSLPIRRVADERQNRTDALNEERTLSGFRVIQRSL